MTQSRARSRSSSTRWFGEKAFSPLERTMKVQRQGLEWNVVEKEEGEELHGREVEMEEENEGNGGLGEERRRRHWNRLEKGEREN